MYPKVSVIIPVYNAEKYIERTLNSIKNQTYKNIEVIVIDDGSTDNSKSIIDNFSGLNLKYYYQNNSGVSVARNKGIELSTGEYIALLDSDDFWKSEKIEIQMNEIITNRFDCCYCGYIQLDNKTGKETRYKTKFKSGFILDDLIRFKTWAQTSTWIIKKTIITENDILFTPFCKYGEDIEFFIKIASVSKVGFSKEYLTYYRVIPDYEFITDLKYLSVINMWNRLDLWIRQNTLFDYSKLIKGYYVPKIALETIYNLYQEKSKEKINYVYCNYKEYFKNIRMVNGLRSIKLIFIYGYFILRKRSLFNGGTK